MKSMERGAGLSLMSSLRLRVTLATALTFVGLGALVCLVLPRAYTEQARQGLRERTTILANGLAYQIQREQALGTRSGSPQRQLGAVAAWLDAEPDFDSALLLDSDGRSLAVWPRTTDDWAADIARDSQLAGDHAYHAAVVRVGTGPVAAVAVRMSTQRVATDLDNMRWLFLSIFVVACVSFWVLSRYLVRGIVDPLEEIRGAAMSLADGEPYVDVPTSGDREIDELGRYIDALGRKRRHSTLLPNPLVTYLQERSPLSRSRREERPS